MGVENLVTEPVFQTWETKQNFSGKYMKCFTNKLMKKNIS